MGAETDHRLNRKAHSSLCGAHRLVLRVMRNIRRCVKELIDAVTTIRFDDTAITTLGMLFNHISRISKEHARLDNLDRLVQTFASCFYHADRVRVCPCLLSYIICFIQVAMKTFVVECDVEIENVAFKKNSLVGYAMADNFVGRCAE